MKISDWSRASIAVTGMNAADNPAPGVAVARSLRAAGHKGRLIGLAYDTLDSGLYNREIFDEIFLVPYPSRGPGPLLDRLREIRRDAGLEIVLPTLDSEMDLYLRLEPEYRELGIASFLPGEASLSMRAKSRLSEFCRREGFATPETRILSSVDSLSRAWDELSDPAGVLPVYIKGVFYDARAARTEAEALAAFHSIAATWGFPVLAQRGMPGFEYNVCCLGDGEGGLIGSVAMRKLGVTSKGKAWSGVTVRNEELRELTERMIRALRWRGPCELEILSVEGSGELLLIEINPRFPAWCYLCTGAGVNLPAAQAMCAAGETLEPLPEARSGVIYSRMAMDIICDLDVLEGLSVSGHAVYHKEATRD